MYNARQGGGVCTLTLHVSCTNFVLSTDYVTLEIGIRSHLPLCHNIKHCLIYSWCSINVYSDTKNSNAFEFHLVAKTILNVNEVLQRG